MGIWIRNTAFFYANSQICDLRTGTPMKFADLQFADCDTKEICGFTICGSIITDFADLRFVDWHNSEICRICDCGMSPRICGFAICGLTKNFCVATSQNRERF